MKVILIDCYGVFYKAHYAFQYNPLINSRGEDTSVVFSFYNFLHRLIVERSPDQVVCVLDSKGPTHRHESYREYKAHRPPMPASLISQIEQIKTSLPHVGLKPIMCSGYEADDIIAHYAHSFTESMDDSKVMVEIFSADKDLYQLVTENVIAISTDQKNKDYVEYNVTRVKEKFGVLPERIADYLALVGDASDNVPGVAGVGKVTAIKLINEHGGVEEMYADLDKVAEKARKKLEASRENALLSKDLVTLKYPVVEMAKQLPKLRELDWGSMNKIGFKDFLEEAECFSLIKKYHLEGVSEGSGNQEENLLEVLKSELPVQLSDTCDLLEQFTREEVFPDNWEKVVTAIRESKEMVFDLETTSLDPFTAKIVALVIVCPTKKEDFFSFYLPLIKLDNETVVEDYESEFVKYFSSIFTDPSIKKIGHNLKFEYAILKSKGIGLEGMAHDTMVFEYLKDPDRTFKLENLIQTYFQVEKKTYKEMVNGRDILEVTSAELREYTFEDGEYTWLIYREQIKSGLLADIQLEKLYYKLEIQLIEVLAEMELAGVWIDTGFLKKLKKQVSKSLKDSQVEIYRMANREFNINSTKQLQEVLFTDLGIKAIKKTKTGFSTDNYVLNKLSKEYPIASELVRYRKNSKLLNTYIEALPKLINSKTGRIHTNYNQSVAATGRLSSSNPNLQNIPIGKESLGMRKAFVAPPGHKVVSIDYSQVELRILAQLCEDERLVEAYKNDEDIHKLTAHLIFNRPVNEITNDERTIAKTINFSVIYGISSFALGEDLNIPRNEAQFFIDSYFNSYPKVREYQKKILDGARENEYVETYYGRRRWVRDVNTKNFSLRGRAERIAFNTVIQGTASDIIKMSMVAIHEKIKAGEIKAKMVMQVHDELVFYVLEKELDQAVKQLAEELCNTEPFDSILQVQVNVADDWNK